MSPPPATAPASGPHLRLRLPFAVTNALIAEVLAGLPPVPVTLGRLGPLATVIGDLTAVPRAVTLGPAGPGLVHVELEVELRASELAINPLTERIDVSLFYGQPSEASLRQRLVMTSADAFSAIDASGDDVTTALHPESLGPLA